MRNLTTNLLSEQAKLNRKPETRLVFRDVMLRLDQNWQSGGVITGYPALTDSDGVPQCPIDMCMREYRPVPGDPYEEQMIRGWSSPTRVYMRVMSDLSTWTGSTYQYITDGMHRVALLTQYIYYAYYDELGSAKNIRYASGANTSVYQNDAYTCDTDHLALAPVRDLSARTGEGLYMAVLHEEGTYKYISLHYLNGYSTVDCPHDIVVDQNFNVSSLQWLDAETLGGDDIIIINTRTYGQPMVITRSPDGVWSTPRYIMRIDELNSNSFLRISHLSVIADSTGDDVLWATGRLSRPGSTGAHPQAFDVALRSKDGEHWTFDRHSYLCSAEMRGKLMVADTGFVYYPGGADAVDQVARGKRTWLMGNDHADLKLEVEDDILSWSLTQPKEGAAMSGSATLAPGDGIYNQDTEDSDYLGRWANSDGDLAIFPGMWLWRYAGYNGYNENISVEGIDATPGSYQVGQRAFSIRSRDIAMRSLYDWSADQTYELLSQVMHRDPCTKLIKLYSISAGQIEVEKEDDEEIKGNVDEDELAEDDTSGQLIFDTPNKPAINLCTKPTEARDFQVKVRFKISDDSGDTDIDDGYITARVGDEQTGTLSYNYNDGEPYFEHSGQDFSVWAAQGTEDAHAAVVVTNSDGTITWGYMGTLYNSEDDKVYIHQDATYGSDRGWNGVTSSGHTPSSYRVWISNPLGTELGTGVGVCGCVTDQYNLIAAIPDLESERLILWIRRGDEDSSAWIPWKVEDMTSSPIKDNEMYETVMVRRGTKVEAQMFRFPYNGGSYGNRESMTSKISSEWPLNEPIVDVSDEDYDQTDRGKVGVVATIAVPEAQLGQCRSDRDWLPVNPDLFNREDDSVNPSLWDDARTYWESFVDGYSWDADSGAWEEDSNYPSGVPPFHFGGETYDPADPDRSYDSDDKFGDQWLSWDADDYDPSTDRWQQVRLSPKYQAGRYTAGLSSYPPVNYESTRGIVLAPQYKDSLWDHATYGHDLEPMFMYGMAHDESTDKYQGAMDAFTEMYTNWVEGSAGSGDKMQVEDVNPEDFATFDVWHHDSGHFPSSWILPGFYLPGRAHPQEPKTAHAKGTKIRQHWNPVLYIEGVWATDGESDKSLEWTMKDIATRAGVLDFDTGYTINGGFAHIGTTPVWLTDVFGDYVFQRDFDITISLTSTVSSGEYMDIYCRMQSRDNSPGGLVLRYGVTANNAYISAYQGDADSGAWRLVDKYEVDSSVVGSEVRLVARERFFTFYIDGHQCPTLTVGPVYGLSSDGWSDDSETAGYMGYYSSEKTSALISQSELWAWTDAIVVDTRQNAIGGLGKALRDRRIKFVPTIGPSGEPVLRISYMALPYTTSNITTFDHWLGTITDHQSGDAGFPSGGAHVSIYRDETGETDRIPSHVRVVGSEVSEYVDHNSARRYGLLFMSHQCPHLEEEEAYQEAARIVRDAISHSGARRPTTAAQLHWEPEDALLLDYTTYDGRDVSDYFIVDSVMLNYTIEPSLEASASLRKLSWGS